MRQLLKNIREVTKVNYEPNNYDGAQKYYFGAIHVDKIVLACYACG